MRSCCPDPFVKASVSWSQWPLLGRPVDREPEEHFSYSTVSFPGSLRTIPGPHKTGRDSLHLTEEPDLTSEVKGISSNLVLQLRTRFYDFRNIPGALASLLSYRVGQKSEVLLRLSDFCSFCLIPLGHRNQSPSFFKWGLSLPPLSENSNILTRIPETAEFQMMATRHFYCQLNPVSSARAKNLPMRNTFNLTLVISSRGQILNAKSLKDL